MHWHITQHEKKKQKWNGEKIMNERTECESILLLPVYIIDLEIGTFDEWHLPEICDIECRWSEQSVYFHRLVSS